jgi:hypothetical protein
MIGASKEALAEGEKGLKEEKRGDGFGRREFSKKMSLERRRSISLRQNFWIKRLDPTEGIITSKEC